MEELAREIRHFEGSVIVSSEDFESSLDRREAIAALTGLARQACKEPVFVIYLRNQISYFESLFQEMLNYGVGEDCPSRVHELMERRTLRVHEWVFHFDYARIMDVFHASAPDACVIFRNYQTLHEGSVVADFCSLVGIESHLIAPDLQYRTNERDDRAASLTLFYHNRIGSLFYRRRDVSIIEHPTVTIINQLTERVSSLDLEIGPELRRIMTSLFSESNRRLCYRHHLPIEGFNAPEIDSKGGMPRIQFERFFSCETQYAIAEIEHLLVEPTRSSGHSGIAAIEAEMDQLTAWWTGQAESLDFLQ